MINAVVEIQNVEGELLVSSKDIAEHFNRRHADILVALDNHVEALKLTSGKMGWYQASTYLDVKGESRRCYLMNRDGFSFLVMGFNNTTPEVVEWKIKYIKAFNDMEKVIKNIHSVPQTYSEALLEAGRLAQELECKKKIIEVQAPKVDVYDAIIENEHLLNIRETMKELRVPEREAIDLLISKRYLYRKPSNKKNRDGTPRKGKILPCSPYNIEPKKYFEVKDRAVNVHDKDREFTVQTFITFLGKEKIREIFIKEGLIQPTLFEV